MKKLKITFTITRRFEALLTCFILLAVLMLPFTAHAQENAKTVRVGWYESAFNQTDEFGRRSGYAYEYQQKIAAYTGWNYEYVEGSWPELLQMLINGEIDLMSDVSKTDQRAEIMLFSELPMGTEEYFIFVARNSEGGVNAENLSSFNGKRFGVNKGSLQESLFRSWAENKNLQVEIIGLTADEEESVSMLNRGEFDAYVSIHTFGRDHDIMPVCRIGASDFFFAVNRNRPELLSELDFAMGRIQEDNVYYIQNLYSKYISYSGAELFLTPSELHWLAGHGPIRVGYRDDYLAFCAQDPATGELTGALKDFLDMASNSAENARIEFVAVPFSTPEGSLEALMRGEVDCLFPTNVSDSDGEKVGLSLTIPLMQTGMVAVVRDGAQDDISLQGNLTVAVNKGNPDYETFLIDHFPHWKRAYFENTEACLAAVADGKADCLLASNYRVSRLSSVLEKYRLATVTTGETMTCSFAMRHEDVTLYAILNKVTNLVPTSVVNAALASHSYSKQPVTFTSFVRQNMIPVLTAMGLVLAAILFLLLRSIRSAQQTRDAMQHIAALNEDQKEKLEKISKLNADLSESQQQLKEALEASKQANRAKTSFLSNMSHEIRTPMNAIIGLNSIALNDPELPPQTREHLDKIGASAKHLLGLINDILDMSRIESGRMELKEEEFSFEEFIEQVNVMVSGQCAEKKLHYECIIIGKTEDCYIGDKMKLKQVLINILGNAVKFTSEPGSVTFTVEQKASFEKYRTLSFIISDTGIGMSKDYIPQIFDTFSQEREGTSNKYGSTGLGMAITKNIVTMMNGDIKVDSEKGVGSTFTVTVTLKAAEHSAHENHDDTPLAGLHALVVDDEQVTREHARLIAEAAGIDTEVAASGQQGLEMIRSCKAKGEAYQLILTDCEMPGMDGIAFTKELRSINGGETMEILLTDYDWKDVREEAIQAGVDAVLHKPLFADTLTQCVRDIMSQRENDAANAPEHTHEEDTPASAGLEGSRMLIAEDMDVNAEILMALLEMRQISSERAENGQIAVEMFSKHPAGYYDAVLMDIRMPVMDGLEAARTIRSMDRPDAKSIPIIAMTANAFEEDVQKTLQAGMNAHLSKPVEPERLYETLSQMIQSRRENNKLEVK